MKRRTSKISALVRQLALLPLMCFLLLGFSDQNFEIPRTTKKAIFLQQGASAKMIKEYNTLAKKYNANPQDQTLIKSSDLKRISYIYNLMTEDQKKKAEPLPRFVTSRGVPETPKTKGELTDLPPPPPEPPSLSPEEFIEEMGAANAEFYFEGERISAKQALKILDTKKDISVVARHENLDRPIVELRSSPIKIKTK